MLRKDLGKQMQLLAAWSAGLAWHGAGGQEGAWKHISILRTVVFNLSLHVGLGP